MGQKNCRTDLIRNISIVILQCINEQSVGLTKTQLFTDQQNRLATYTKALAHPARLAIIQYLLRHQTCICGDLVNELHLAQPTISQHLKELKAAGFIKGEIEGTKVCYCIDGQVWEEARGMLFELFLTPLSCTDQCC
jgi:DNA-binding transcriptional ArsR family regulator